MSKWSKVSDVEKLPEISEDVLVYFSHGWMRVSRRVLKDTRFVKEDPDCNWEWFPGHPLMDHEITHHRPLPKGPCDED